MPTDKIPTKYNTKKLKYNKEFIQSKRKDNDYTNNENTKNGN